MKGRPRTLESYESTVRLHLDPWIGHQRLDKLQPEHLEELYTELAHQGLSAATILRVHRVLARALKVATQRGKIARNVALLLDPPAVKRPDTALPLTAEEAKAVMTAARTTRNSARWTVALAVGLRQSEALGLRWSDIDLALGKLSVKRGLHRVAGQGLIYEDPKSERSRRTIALPRPLIEALHAHRIEQDQERRTAADLWEDHQLVFAQPNGRPIDRKTDWQAWKAVLNSAGVRDVRLHDGRHTAATLLLTAGVHPRVVMELLGHSQMRTTTDTYSHVMPALAQEAADRMTDTLWERYGIPDATPTGTTQADDRER
jgi:integrase